jgi:hypothetical protein
MLLSLLASFQARLSHFAKMIKTNCDIFEIVKIITKAALGSNSRIT